MREISTATCPGCGLTVELETLVVEGDVWSVGSEDSAETRAWIGADVPPEQARDWVAARIPPIPADEPAEDASLPSLRRLRPGDLPHARRRWREDAGSVRLRLAQLLLRELPVPLGGRRY